MESTEATVKRTKCRRTQRRLLARACVVVVEYRAKHAEWPKVDYVSVAANVSHGTAWAAIKQVRELVGLPGEEAA